MAKRKRFNAWILILLCVALLLVAVIGSGFSLNFSTILDKLNGKDDKIFVCDLNSPCISFGCEYYSQDKNDYNVCYIKISGLDPSKEYMVDLSENFSDLDESCICLSDGEKHCLYSPLRLNGSLCYYYNEAVIDANGFDPKAFSFFYDDSSDDSGVSEYCHKYNEPLHLKDLESDTVFIFICDTSDSGMTNISDHFNHVNLYEIEG